MNGDILNELLQVDEIMDSMVLLMIRNHELRQSSEKQEDEIYLD